MRDLQKSESFESLDELTLNTFKDSTSSGITCVLFYRQGLNICEYMEDYLGQIKEDDNKVRYYKLNIEENPAQYGKYDISGVPTVVFYNEGEEIERIMGVVSKSNLKLIKSRAIR